MTTHAGCPDESKWESTFRDDMIDALESADYEIATLKTKCRSALQRCADAMVELLDAEVKTSQHWMELRLAKNNAQRVIDDECDD